MRQRIAIKLAGGGILLAAIVASLWLLPAREYATRLVDWAREVGPWGAFLLAGLYVPACLFFVPGWILSVTAGFTFGVVWGTIAVSLGSVAGATAAFLAGRTLLRDAIERRVADRPRFAALDRAVAGNGFKIVLLTRLSPVFPFNLLNYAYGLTGVSLRDYVVASWIGMLPGTIVYVYVGSAADRLADLLAGDFSGRSGPRALFWMGLVAAVAVAVLVTRLARQALDHSIAEDRITDAAGESAADRELAGSNREQLHGASHGV